MKKTEYQIRGIIVSGYQFGEYLAIRDKLSECKGPFDRKKCHNRGRWALEHLPTSTIVCRGATRAELVELVKARPNTDKDFPDLPLDTCDVSELVANINYSWPDWVTAIHAQRERYR